jgi:hypothetical protein
VRNRTVLMVADISPHIGAKRHQIASKYRNIMTSHKRPQKPPEIAAEPRVLNSTLNNTEWSSRTSRSVVLSWR